MSFRSKTMKVQNERDLGNGGLKKFFFLQKLKLHPLNFIANIGSKWEGSIACNQKIFSQI